MLQARDPAYDVFDRGLAFWRAAGLKVVKWISAGLLLALAFHNVWTFDRDVANLRTRDADELLIEDRRYEGIRATLQRLGYLSGQITFITDSDLGYEANRSRDDTNWARAQFAMAPWVILKNGVRLPDAAFVSLSSSFVIADVSDPGRLMPDLEKIYDAGNGLMLFRRIHR